MHQKPYINIDILCLIWYLSNLRHYCMKATLTLADTTEEFQESYDYMYGPRKAMGPDYRIVRVQAVDTCW